MDQVLLAVLSLAAILFTQEPRLRCQKWAPVLGLLSQPFWFYSAWVSQQWGIFALCFAYTAIWARGFWVQWVVAVCVAPQCQTDIVK